MHDEIVYTQYPLVPEEGLFDLAHELRGGRLPEQGAYRVFGGVISGEQDAGGDE